MSSERDFAEKLPVPAEAPLWLRCRAKRGRQNHAEQIFVSGQRSAGEGTQPSGYERSRSKKIQAAMVNC
jgi:hypothetical protein